MIESKNGYSSHYLRVTTATAKTSSTTPRLQNAKQKYLCHDCGRQSRENPASNACTRHKGARRSLAHTRNQERSSLRGLAAHLRGLLAQHRHALAQEKPLGCRLLGTNLTAPRATSFGETSCSNSTSCGCSLARKPTSAGYGSPWRARQVLAYYVIGDRGERTCQRLWERLPESYKGGCSC